MTNNEINIAITKKFFPDKCWHERATNAKDAECGKCTAPHHKNPDYCGNIGDAFRLVTELEMRKVYLKLVTMNIVTSQPVAKFFSIIEGNFQQESIRRADTPAKAICLASLGVKINE